MIDLISRAAAIDALIQEGRNVDSCYLESERIIHESDAVEAISMLPSIQPEQQWISCSKRLPKKSGQYYVSGGDKIWICEFLIIPNFTGGWCNDASNPVVQAWMPLPEPYREGRKDEFNTERD